MDCVAKIYTTEEVSKKLGRLLNLSQEKEGIYFSRCLADLRNSLRAPFDTPFYCFRAIECLRQAFCIQFQLYPEKQRAESWNALRKELGITRDLISENIQKYAMPNRHGYIEEFSEEQRAKILETTWGIVDRYIEYSNKNNDD